MPEQPKPFLILATVRTGSYYLVDLLDSAPDVTCYGEVYKPNFVELPPDTREALGLEGKDIEARDSMGEALTDRLRALTPERIVGYKVFPNHMQKSSFLEEMLASGRYNVVILSRPVLEVYASLEAARATETFVVRDDAARVESPPLTFRPQQLDQTEGFIGRFRSIARKLRRTKRVETFDIRYAELDDPKWRERLLRFVGSDADPQQLTAGTLRQSSRPLHRRIANWNALVRYLRHSDRLALLGEAGYRPDGKPYRG